MALYTVTRWSGRREPARLLYSGPDETKARDLHRTVAARLMQGDVEMYINGDRDPTVRDWAPGLRPRW